MKLIAFVLAVLLLTANVNSVPCADGTIGKIHNCLDCATTAYDSECNYCPSGYYKFDANSCKQCPGGTGRTTVLSYTPIENVNVCGKCAPQLNCDTCTGEPYSCTSCSNGKFLEIATFSNSIYGFGCSTNCQAFGNTSLVPNSVSNVAPNYCNNCGVGCAKCEYSPYMRPRAGANTSPDTIKCLEAAQSYYLLPNTSDSSIVPRVMRCGANCKKCTDRLNCQECMPGWGKFPDETGDCSVNYGGGLTYQNATGTFNNLSNLTNSSNPSNNCPSKSSASLLQVCLLILSFAYMTL
jgi:hypothetical protein